MRWILCLIYLHVSLHAGYIIVNKKNPISKLDVFEIQQIFTLKRLSWDDGSTISVYMLPSASPTQNRFTNSYLHMNAREVYERWMAYILNGGMNKPPIFLNERRLIKQIKKNVYSIGIVSKRSKLPSGVKVIYHFRETP